MGWNNKKLSHATVPLRSKILVRRPYSMVLPLVSFSMISSFCWFWVNLINYVQYLWEHFMSSIIKKPLAFSFFLACISNKLLNNKTHKFIQVVPNIHIYSPQSNKLIKQVGEERWFWLVWRLLYSVCCFMKKVEANKWSLIGGRIWLHPFVLVFFTFLAG
jgi:hypothetical protein